MKLKFILLLLLITNKRKVDQFQLKDRNLEYNYNDSECFHKSDSINDLDFSTQKMINEIRKFFIRRLKWDDQNSRNLINNYNITHKKNISISSKIPLQHSDTSKVTKYDKQYFPSKMIQTIYIMQGLKLSPQLIFFFF